MFILENLGKSIRKEKLEQENICFYKETAQLLCLHPYLSDFFRNSIKELANLLKCFVMNQMFSSNILFDSDSHQLHPTKGNNSYYYYGIQSNSLFNKPERSVCMAQNLQETKIRSFVFKVECWDVRVVRSVENVYL